MLKSRRAIVVASTLSALAFLAGCATEPSQTTADPAARATIAAGTEGAVNFEGGYLQIGSGPKAVDVYLDPMCPYCRLFEEKSGPMLFNAANNGDATIRIHPVAILDRLSRGTAYSTRAAALLTAVAAKYPRKTVEFVQDLYAYQPSEGTAGLTDNQLRDIARHAGISVPEQLDAAQYRMWVKQSTARAMAGPLPTTSQLTAIRTVPTIVVDGNVFPGSSNQTAAFARFYLSH